VPSIPGINHQDAVRVLEWFKATVDAAGGGNYQTIMSASIR
jgi:hypothetical protein